MYAASINWLQSGTSQQRCVRRAKNKRRVGDERNMRWGYTMIGANDELLHIWTTSAFRYNSCQTSGSPWNSGPADGKPRLALLCSTVGTTTVVEALELSIHTCSYRVPGIKHKTKQETFFLPFFSDDPAMIVTIEIFLLTVIGPVPDVDSLIMHCTWPYNI